VDAGELSRKYATAIFSLALDEWLTSLNSVRSAVSNDAKLATVLTTRETPYQEKQALLDKILPAKTIEAVRNFLYTLLKQDDFGLLDDVITELEHISRGGPQVQTTYVTTAMGLGDAEKEKFQQTLRKKYGDNLEFVFRVDPSIIGGAIVQVGDKLIDGSIACRLEALSNTIGVKS
jgi:F-type H+-transporting ATPase subunit delta